ncbi:MAG: pknB 22 [Planctomycetota bacterium]|nr:pknB 22 [Planctomycetota bacterium]
MSDIGARDGLAPDDEARAAALPDAYLADLEAGRPVDPSRLLAEHPALADRLRAGLELFRLIDAAANDPGAPGNDTTSPRSDAAPAGPGSGASTSLWSDFGPIPRVLLRDPHGASGPPVRPGSPAMPGSGTWRYQLFGEIARGGMGVVLKGRDPDLGRDLAVKVMLEAHRDDPETVRRFVEEAQIGGQLQHRGIVPVYELGSFPDRRPFFAMKLVQGRTLTAIRRERGREVAGEPKARLIGIFEQICQTMAYAHARGVIHRDLKPSNVMVGSFGEVKVMDWGPAKVLPHGGVADEEQAGGTPASGPVHTARSGPGADASRAGSVMGHRPTWRRSTPGARSSGWTSAATSSPWAQSSARYSSAPRPTRAKTAARSPPRPRPATWPTCGRGWAPAGPIPI